MENSIETRKIKDETILERWSVLIKNAHGNGEKIYNRTAEFIQELQAPGINSEMVKLRTDRIERGGGFFTKFVERDYLMVTHDHLRDFRMYIGARDFGSALYVSWYLTCAPNFLKKTISGLLTKDPQSLSFMFMSDIFRQEDLTAYVTAIHHALIDATKEVSESVGFDFTKVDQKSKGFLNIS